LQVMEEGTLTDARGRRVDFRNTIIIMTSNVGADVIKRGARLGFEIKDETERGEQERYGDMVKNVTDQVRKMFRPEFLNRVDATIVFRSLSRDEIKQIVDLELDKVRARLIEHAITLDMTEESRDWLAVKGYDIEFGARPLRRLIQNSVEDTLSDGILSGKFSIGDTVRVTAAEGADELTLEPVSFVDDEPAESAETTAT
jgi:ATP-dependent Clp protease ATP-binding subunit ClpC